MQGHMQMHGQPAYPPYQGYQQQMSGQNHHYPQQPEYSQHYGYYGQSYQMPPGYVQGPPHTPRTPGGYKGQPPMGHQQYGGHGQFNQPPSQTMSRTSSQMSERPASSIGSTQPHSTGAGATSQPSHGHGHSQSISGPPQGANIKIPSRQSKAIAIKNPDGEVISIEKKSASPAPPANGPSPAPAVVSSTPSPAPQAPTSSSHVRTESKSGKTASQIREEFMNNVKKGQEKDTPPLKEESATSEKSSTAAEPAKPSPVPTPAPAAPENKPTESPAQPAEPKFSTESTDTAGKEQAMAPATSGEKADSSKETDDERKKREEEELERMIAEMEAKDKEDEEREKAFNEKRQKEIAERKQREAQEASMDDEKMRNAEREAEAREEAREKEKKTNEVEDSEQAESQKLFADLKKPTLGPGAEEHAETESRASTPATSDRDSMPPPARAAKAAGLSRAKPAPAALKLETAKSVEPAQPTPGMRSLRSARMLQLQSESITYPEGVQSPNPALNQAGRRQGRLYDTDFLMQFQDAFKEKPSLDWDAKVKETLGDSNDAPKSARVPQTPGGGRGGGRTPSQNFPPAGMGNFNAPGGRRPGGPMGSFDPSKMGAPIGQFGAGRPPFPGAAMGRPPSQAASQMHASQRGSSNRGSKAGSKMTLKQQEQANSKMPLTAGADLKPLEASGSGWKPMSLTRSAPVADTSAHMAPDMVQRKVKASLNKMTPERFEKISAQIMIIAAQSKAETDGRTLRQVIALTFEKACDEAHWASMYAQFCQRMLQEMSTEIMDENVRDKSGQQVVGGALFRKYLLNRCQEEFERGWVTNLPENSEGQTEETAMLSDEYYKAAAAKRKGLGLVQFIGELYKLRMLSIKIMHQCVTKLLDFDGEPDEASIESLCKLLRTVGGTMESEVEGQKLTKMYFERITKVMDEFNLPSRLQFMLMDVVDLKKGGWRDKEAQKGPKTIQQIHEEAIAAQQKAEAEKSRQNNQRRMPSGRQDSRNFPNPPPPQDYSRNTLGSDDLRKLSQKRESRASLGPTKSLGPTTMLGSRSSSGRQGFGPPTGLMSRTESQAGSSPGGSGMHSRTASIKADPKKEEEAKTSANAFSALASMDGDEAASPPMTKSQPATEGSKAD